MQEKESIDKVLAAVCKYYDVGVIELKGSSRRTHLIKPRYVAMALLLKGGLGYSRIGRIIGGRDHTTVIHGISKVNALWADELDKFKDIKFDLSEIKNPYTERPKKWKKIYEYFGGKCVICGFSDVVQIHHLIPRSIGGSDSISNLVVLCPNHHALLHLGLVDISNLSTIKELVVPTPNSNNK